MKHLIVIYVSLALFTACFVARGRYSPPTDAQINNLKGSVSVITSRYLNIEGEDPDDPARDTGFDMLIVTTYNRQGNITSEETYSRGGQRLSRRDVYTYDERGSNLISSEYHNVPEDKVSWIHYKYDERGRLGEYYAVGGDWRSSLEYGKRDYPVRMVTVAADTVSDVIDYGYDRRGRLVREGETVNKYRGKVLRERVREFYREQYDKNGDLLRTINTITDSSEADEQTREGIVEAVYRYDRHGNWIRRELRTAGELFGVWIREIEYF